MRFVMNFFNIYIPNSDLSILHPLTHVSQLFILSSNQLVDLQINFNMDDCKLIDLFLCGGNAGFEILCI